MSDLEAAVLIDGLRFSISMGALSISISTIIAGVSIAAAIRSLKDGQKK